MQPMAAIGRRLFIRTIHMLLVVWGSLTLVFFVSRVLPADPAVVLSGPEPTAAMIEATRHRLGLDRPLSEQYATYVSGLLWGDLGRSAITGHPVSYDLDARLPATLELVAVSLIMAIAISFTLAIIAAQRPGGWIDRLASGIVLARTAMPTFFVGVLLVWLFYTVFSVAPAPVGRLPVGVGAPPGVTRFYLIDSLLAGRVDLFWLALKHLALPAITLSTSLIPSLLNVLRSNIRTALTTDSLLVLRHSPIGRFRLWSRYILPLAIVPTLTLLAASFGSLVGGTVVVEHIFAWNGVGSYVLHGINTGDYFVVQGVVLISALGYAVAFFVVDVLSWWMDPRMMEADYAQNSTT